DPAQGVVCQRALAGKDAGYWNAPVDAVRRRAPLLLASFGVLGVCRLWPGDGLAVAASNQEKAFTGCAGAIVACAQGSPLHFVAHGPQALNEVLPVVAFAAFVRHQVLILNRYPFTWRRNGAVQFDHAAGLRAPFCH